MLYNFLYILKISISIFYKLLMHVTIHGAMFRIADAFKSGVNIQYYSLALLNGI